MDQKEEDIKDILNSLNGIKRAEANPFLYEKIMNRMQTAADGGRKTVVYLRVQLATLLLFLSINSYLLLSDSPGKSGAKNSSVIANDYFGTNANYNY